MRQMMHRCRHLPMQITSPTTLARLALRAQARCKVVSTLSTTLARLLLRSQAVCKEESNHG